MNAKKLTMMQACLLFIIMKYSAVVRLLPTYTAQSAKQAGWVSAIVGSLGLIIVIFIIKVYVEKFPNTSYPDILCKITGKPIAKILTAIYLIWFIILLSLYCRYFGERLVASVYAATDINVFIIVILILVGFTLRSGIGVIARMNKLIFPLIVIQLLLIIALLIVKIDVHKLLPVSSLDILPIFKGTLAPMGVLVYLFFLFMISDEIITDRGFSKNMTFTLIYGVVINFLLVSTLMGTFGFNTLIRTPFPILIATKNISAGGKFSGLESIFISFWILADYINIATFSYLIIRLLKSLFSLKDARPILSAILILAFFLSHLLADEFFELQAFSTKVALQTNIILGLAVPLVLLGVAKIRKLI